MSLRDYARALRKNWWLVLLTTVAGTALATVLVAQATPVYEGEVTFFATTPSDSSDSLLQGDQFGQQRVNSYVQLLGSERLANKIVASTEIDRTTEQIMDSVEGEADLNTVLLTAFVQGSSIDEVDLIVEAVASEFPELVEEIESQSGTREPSVLLEVVSGPSVDPDPVRPLEALWIAVGLLAGLLIGIAVVLLRALLDRTVRDPDALRRVTGAPLLGRIPFVRGSNKAPLLARGNASGAQAEAFRQLRTNVQFVDFERPVAVLAVTSAVAEEGKTVSAANLATTFAQAGKRVLLIEADLRRPRLAALLELEESTGLTNVLAGQLRLDEVIQPGSDSMHFVASGPVPPNPSELLASDGMVHLLEEARRGYDLVVIDTPPLLPVTDGAVVAARADGAVLVVRYGKTRQADVEQAVESLQAVDVRVLGTVLNRVPNHGRDSHSYPSQPTGRNDRTTKDSTDGVHRPVGSTHDEHR